MIPRRDRNQIIQQARASRRDILPQIIDPIKTPIDFLQNSEVDQVPFTISDGVRITVTTTFTSSANPTGVRMGAVPIMFAFFKDSLNVNNLIPHSSGISSNDYLVEGPHAMPQFSPGGHDGANLVYKTSITNNSGSSQDIILLVQFRFIAAGGGGGE